MNGSMLLVLLVLAGQVAPGWPGTSPSQIDDNTPVVSKDYGWQINPDTKEFEFIIQLSPEKATDMVRSDLESWSEIHPEVAVRIRKVVVAIGTKSLTSMAINDVRRLPPVLGAIDSNVQSEVGKGRFADLESSRPGEMFNVAGGAPPPSLPTGGIASSLSDNPGAVVTNPAANLLDALKDKGGLLAQNSADAFLNEARGATNSSLNSKFSNTGQPATPTQPTVSTPLAGAAPAIPGLNPQMPASPANNPNLSGAGLPTIAGNTATPPGMSLPNFPNAAPSSNPTPGTFNPNLPAANPVSSNPAYLNTNPTATGNFGAPPRGTAMQPFNNYTSAPNAGGTLGNAALANNQPAENYLTNPMGTGQFPMQSPGMYPQQSDPPSYAPSTRLADNRLPTTSGNAPATNPNLVGTGLSASDLRDDQWRESQSAAASNRGSNNRAASSNRDLGSAEYPERNGMDNIVPIMFVLSLVVNVYLGMLIRKLLGRYRTLLASVRSQTI